MPSIISFIGQVASGSTSDSFTTIQPDVGTSPVATSATDTLTLTSSDGTVTITGNATTDTIDFSVSASASPGFSWGRSGAIPTNTYLLNDSVPSNVTGRVVPLTTGTIKKAVIACGTSSTFDVKIQRRSGASFVDLATVSVSAARTKVQTLSVSVSSGDELAILVSSGSTDNLVVSLIMVGTE